MTEEFEDGRREPLRILLVGSLPPAQGGTCVSLMHLREALAARDDVEVRVVNTSIGGFGTPWRNARRFFRAAWIISMAVWRVEVVTLHVNTASVHSIGLFCWLAARISGRPLVLRKFGGTDFLDYGRLRRTLARWAVVNSDLYLAQTKALVASALENGIQHVEWYPTNRPMRPADELSAPRSESCGRFVFLGLVGRHKGILELIAAAERFDRSITVDVYGPLVDGISEETFSGLRNVAYRGVLDPHDVPRVLERYDALVLPTRHMGEGYPGVVVEAYEAGIPVIASRWLSIPEIVDETCGILIEPGNTDELFAAMGRLIEDGESYLRLRQGALAKREEFNLEPLADRFVASCRRLARRKAVAGG